VIGVVGAGAIDCARVEDRGEQGRPGERLPARRRPGALADFEKTEKLLKDLGYGSIRTFLGDGYSGLSMFAPFDKIIITAGAPVIPEALLDQLKIGGIMVIPLGDTVQIMTSIIKVATKKFEKTEYGAFKFVPLLENKEWGL
jgi:protein-L-isoaspartate O-methyltransferase